MNIVPVAFAFDSNLVFPACICMSSLMMNGHKDTFYDIFILHSSKVQLDCSQINQLSRYYSNCRIQYREVDETFDGAFEIRGITIPAYYRLLIPELIPEYTKIIYSDVDVIFREDLSRWYNMDLEENYFAGVNSMAGLNADLNAYYIGLGLDVEKIIYSGNLIINSSKIIKDGLIGVFKSLALNKYKFQDMDIINIACKDNIKYLSPSFCVTTYFYENVLYKRNHVDKYFSDFEIDEAFLYGTIHYNGMKPWIDFCINFDIWWEYYRKSPFFDKKFYFDFFYSKLDELDHLSLWKRIKILLRYFIVGKK